MLLIFLRFIYTVQIYPIMLVVFFALFIERELWQSYLLRYLDVNLQGESINRQSMLMRVLLHFDGLPSWKIGLLPQKKVSFSECRWFVVLQHLSIMLSYQDVLLEFEINGREYIKTIIVQNGKNKSKKSSQWHVSLLYLNGKEHL